MQNWSAARMQPTWSVIIPEWSSVKSLVCCVIAENNAFVRQSPANELRKLGNKELTVGKSRLKDGCHEVALIGLRQVNLSWRLHAADKAMAFN